MNLHAHCLQMSLRKISAGLTKTRIWVYFKTNRELTIPIYLRDIILVVISFNFYNMAVIINPSVNINIVYSTEHDYEYLINEGIAS